ncbi:MAG: hypothetical protein NC181_02010 [Clostridium sp.]|nr:hypothetical protein [Clostridium sp.]MCM1444081.1 hypothetical protein [Candidatus Amulumruptor caecigallinarius]
MKAFGYNKNDEEFEKILELSQVTLSCKKEDLDKIIEFLTEVKRKIKNKVDNAEHWHYRDYNKSWTEEESDLILFMD